MSKARLIITAVILEGRSQTEVAREYGVSKGWVSKLVARYRREGAAAIYTTRPKAAPGDACTTADPGRIRTDTIDKAGSVTLRHNGKLHHIGIGRIHEGTRVILIVEGLHIRALNATTGELLRQLTLDPTRDYQPTGRPKGPTRPA